MPFLIVFLLLVEYVLLTSTAVYMVSVLSRAIEGVPWSKCLQLYPVLQASAAPEGKQRPGTAPSAFSAAAREDADSRRTASTSAIAASPFANSAFASGAAQQPEDGNQQQQQQQQRGLQRASSPALGSGVTAQTVADGLPSAPSAPLTDRDGGAGPAGSAGAVDGGRRWAAGASPYSQEYAAPRTTDSPSVSGILTALPHRNSGHFGRLSGESPRSGSTPRQLGVFASHPIPEEGDLVTAEDQGGGKNSPARPADGKAGGVGKDASGFSVQAR